MVGRVHSRWWAPFLVLVACGGPPHVDRDPADYLAVGVDPAEEARTLSETLADDGYRVTRTVDEDGWSAFAMTRTDGASLARLVTRRGVVVALDETPMPLSPPRGVLDVEPSPPSGTDLDRDGTPDVVLARQERDRRCLMVVGVDDDGGARPLVVDTANLAVDVCLEEVRDVDGNEAPEAIVRVRARALARGVVPAADLPLERDADGVYRRVDPAERFVAVERAAREARLAAARSVPDAEAAYTAAVELALVAFVAGDAPDAQVAAFDDAMNGIVLDVDLLTAVHFARGEIAAGRVAR
jgi:hypothetical protein